MVIATVLLPALFFAFCGLCENLIYKVEPTPDTTKNTTASNRLAIITGPAMTKLKIPIIKELGSRQSFPPSQDMTMQGKGEDTHNNDNSSTEQAEKESTDVSIDIVSDNGKDKPSSVTENKTNESTSETLSNIINEICDDNKETKSIKSARSTKDQTQ